MHLGDNLSRHSPIILKLDLGKIPARKIGSTATPRRPAWYKADQEAKDHFTGSVHDKLSLLQVTESLLCSNPHCKYEIHSEERDSLVLDIMSSVIESSHQDIPMNGARRSPRSPECPVDKAIPGWKDVVAPYKEDAKFWHGVWQSADRPSHGVLKNIMIRTRNQYHYAIRRVKKMSNTIRAKKLLEASQLGSCQLLKEIKKVKGSKKEVNDLPEVVGGASGQAQIVEEFKNVYSALYNLNDH